MSQSLLFRSVEKNRHFPSHLEVFPVLPNLKRKYNPTRLDCGCWEHCGLILVGTNDCLKKGECRDLRLLLRPHPQRVGTLGPQVTSCLCVATRMLPVCLFTPVFPRPVLKQEAEGTYNRTPNFLSLTFLTCKMGIIPASQAVVRI